MAPDDNLPLVGFTDCEFSTWFEAHILCKFSAPQAIAAKRIMAERDEARQAIETLSQQLKGLKRELAQAKSYSSRPN